MRKEILEKVQKILEKEKKEEKAILRAGENAPLPPEIAKEAERAYGCFVKTGDKLLKKIKEQKRILTYKEAYETATTMIYVNFSDKDYAVIEFNEYSLAGLFIYGKIPTEKVEIIKGCIQESGLILLTDEERKEIEKKYYWPDIFY